MKFEVYCDEANPDVLTSASPRARHLMIGSLWLPENLRNEVKARVTALRKRHQTWGEIKWSKASPNRRDFYVELVDLFFAYGDNLRFRCIAVDRTQLNLALHDNDGELGFYKFYYQLLHHWILDFNIYRIFCDVKSNRDPKRLPVLARCLSRANLTSSVEYIQALPRPPRGATPQVCAGTRACAHSQGRGEIQHLQDSPARGVVTASPPLVHYATAAEYRTHYERVYCRGTIHTFDGIRVYFSPRKFGHVFYESTARDGRKDVFSPVRAQRIDWIKATLEHPQAALFAGWDKRARRYDTMRHAA